MKKVLLLLISVITLNMTAEACKCQKKDNSFMYLIESKHVFLGTVISVEECGDNNKFSHELYIEKNHKGKLKSKEIIYTDCVTSCGFQLEEGQRYLIFSNLDNHNIGFCDLIIPFSDSSFIPIKQYLDEIAYARLDYLELYETVDKSGYRAKLMVQNGLVRGVVNIFDEAGNNVLQGIVGKGHMQGYYEIRTFGIKENEIWTGNYKDGKRIGDWVYKVMPNGDVEKKNRYILYQYEAGEVVKVSDLSIEAQLEEYEPKKADNEQNK